MIGNQSNHSDGIDYYAAYSSNFDVAEKDTSYYILNITIINDHILEEKNERFRVNVLHPELADDQNHCFADIIIMDDDGKLLIYVK